MRARGFWFLAVLALFGGGMSTLAGDADEDWKEIVSLDAGPPQRATSAQAAGAMVLAHLDRQEKALRGFLDAHPQDARVFEGRLRLARLLQIRADFENSDKARLEAKRILDSLEKTATPEQRVELDFAKIARLMRSLRPSDEAQRQGLLSAARAFQAAHPADRRLAALLAEVSTLFDAQPKTKEILLEDAQALPGDDELKNRIADDLKRVRLLGQEVPLSFTSVQGREIKAEDLRGRPLFVIFFADFSPPSTAAVTTLQKAVADLPKGSVRVVGIDLDEKPETLTALMKARGITWPVAFDGKGWQSPLARALGINALPTVWLLDARGRLRSLNALDGAAAKARQLLQER